MAKIKFEGVAAKRSAAEVKDGYADLEWDNAWVVDGTAIPDSGFDNVLRSGRGAAFNFGAKPVSFGSTDTDADFDLLDGYFAAAWDEGLKVKVFAYDDGKRVGVERFTLDQDRTRIKFDEDFQGIDKVRIVSKGGRDADPEDAGDGHQIAFDNLNIDWL